MSVLLALVLLQSAVPDTPALSRADAVARALQANPVVRRSEEEMGVYRGRRQEALADALPELTVFGTATRYRDPSLLNSSSFDAFPAELRESLTPVGTNLYEGTAQLKQTLFSFKLGAAIKAARLGMKLGQEGIVRSRQDVALVAVRAYDDLLLAREKVVVARKAVVQKQKHLESVRNRRAAGVATELDVLRSEVDLANQQSQLIRFQGEADLARSSLNAVLVRPLATPVEPTDGLAVEAFELDAPQALADALAHRPEMREMALNERIYGHLERVARSEALPRLDVDGVFGWSVRQPDSFLKTDFAKWNATVSLTVPVFDGFRTAGKVAQVRAQRRQLEQDRVALENQIRLEVQAGFERLATAQSVLQAAALNVSQARRALEMTEANYGYGAATTLDVLDAQAALTLAESLHVQALYDRRHAISALRYAMGRDPLGAALETSR
jgi:outer membrane protein TolC